MLFLAQPRRKNAEARGASTGKPAAYRKCQTGFEPPQLGHVQRQRCVCVRGVARQPGRNRGRARGEGSHQREGGHDPSALIRGRGESVGLSRRAQCLAADPVSPQVETPLHHVVYRPRHWDARIPEAGAHSPSPSQDSSRSVHSTRLTPRSHQQPQLAPFSPTPLPLIRPLLFPPTINPRLSPPEASVPPSF